MVHLEAMLLAGGGERVDDGGVEVCSHVSEEVRERVRLGPPPGCGRPVGGERVEGVRHGEDAGGERDFLPLQPAGYPEPSQRSWCA